MEITAAMVKELRERTGSGMMECKKALTEAQGDIEAAVEIMRKAGMAKADKRAGRVAAEGRIVIARSQDGKNVVIAEINCETDFVARGDDFIAFGNQVAQQALNKRPADVDALSQLPLQGDKGPSINEARQELVAKIGENIGIRRFDVLSTQGVIGDYLHGTRIGVVVEMQGGDQTLAKDIAMHVAASKPVCVKPEEVSAELIRKEKEIYMAQAAESGKPANIVEKMVEGRVTKFLREITLVGQPFVKNPDITVEKLLKDAGAGVVRFVRYEVGEGIEKKVDNFVQEVMAQARGG